MSIALVFILKLKLASHIDCSICGHHLVTWSFNLLCVAIMCCDRHINIITAHTYRMHTIPVDRISQGTFNTLKNHKTKFCMQLLYNPLTSKAWFQRKMGTSVYETKKFH